MTPTFFQVNTPQVTWKLARIPGEKLSAVTARVKEFEKDATDPVTGKVVARIDPSSLVEAERVKNPNGDVLNGIAYDRENDKIYVTGKLWSSIYQLNFTH